MSQLRPLSEVHKVRDILFKQYLKIWRFNKRLISEKLNLSTGGFANKLSDKNADKLTEKQKEELRQLFKELAEDATNILI